MQKAWEADGVDLETLIEQVDPPFSDEIMREVLPPKFKVPNIKSYDGKSDPVEHLDSYKSWMELHGVPDAIRCRAFSFSLVGPTKDWFQKLKRRLISSFKELTRAFITQFLGGRD